MKIELKEPKNIKFREEFSFVFPYFQGEKIDIENQEIKKEIKRFFEVLPLLKENEIRLALFNKKKIIFLNLGEKKKWNQRKFLLNLRKIIRFLKEQRIEQAILFLDYIIPQNIDRHNLTRQISENILLADYELTRYKKEPKEGWPKIKLIEISWPESLKYQKDLSQGEIIGQAVNFTRDLANTPGGEMTPEKLALAAKKAIKKFKSIQIEIFNKEKLRKMGMGGILGVAQGSSQQPKLIILKYWGKRDKKRDVDLVFVGKGVTFDSGGLHIKPGLSMAEMHMDMSGGGAVLGAILAIAQIKLPLNIIALIPAVENMPSGQSLRPGDLLKTYNGQTIEVITTDTEGRVILADALAYGVKNFNPKLIINVATLTEAAMVALGQRASGLFTNLPEREAFFRQIGEDSGDYVWPLPCWEEYEEEIKGTFGDIANLGKYGRYGEAITGALFLKNFVGNSPWVHLDIAPTNTSIDNQGLAKGATGTGVRYLVKLAQDFSKIKTYL